MTNLTEKWAPILDHKDLPEIADPYRKAVTAQLLENQEKFLKEQAAVGVSSSGLLTEDSLTSEVGTNGFQSSANAEGPRAGFDPVMISMIRRAMPNLIAYDICGVQPMSGPTGLIFAMRAMYDGQAGPNEALFDEADVQFSNKAGGLSTTSPYTYPDGFGGSTSAAEVSKAVPYPYVPGATPPEQNPGLLETHDSPAGITTATSYVDAQGNTVNTPPGGDGYDPTLGQMEGMQKGTMEVLGTSGNEFRQMGFSIEKAIVEAKGRALKAQYSIELAQDLRAIHGLDAEAELANILSSEILAEINREVVRTINYTATAGAQDNTTTAGTFDLDVDANGRWSVERFKGLVFQIEREANQIAKSTRRGKGNVMICGSDVASALQMAGVLDYTPALSANLNVDDTGNTFAGVLNGRTKVYVDPYFSSAGGDQYVTVGYKGASAFDAGLFYCPYVPLQMVRAVGENTFQPKIGFKTRYGMVANPFATTAADGAISSQKKNIYYRIVTVSNLM